MVCKEVEEIRSYDLRSVEGTGLKEQMVGQLEITLLVEKLREGGRRW